MTAAPFEGREPGTWPPPPDHPKHGPAEATYLYTDAAGEPLYYVCRYEVPPASEEEEPGKTFLQGHYNGTGRWVWNLKGVEPALYRLPAVRAHIARGEEHSPLYIVEGEKAVEYLRRYLDQHALPGEVTCNPMGAGKWREPYTEAVRGCRWVVVVADNDKPGFDGGRQVQAEVGPHVDRLELVRPAVPDEHAGVDDHLEAGHTLEELVPLEPEEAGEEEAAPQPFPGLSHAEVLELSFEGERHLVADLIEKGTVGAIAGVPETHKSRLAQGVASAVALEEGEVLGRQVEAGGPVGFFWQDDSRRNEAERVQAYSAARELPRELRVRWHLNEGVVLPRDLARLRATIEEHGYVLVVLDSFYNFAAAELELKSEEAALIVAALKREVCDPTGCTVLIVDHAPWPSEGNKGQRRAYGSVLKSAAIRWAIFLERKDSKLYVQASGNNVRGIPRSPAVWDEEAHELRLVAVHGTDPAVLVEALAWVAAYVEAEYAKSSRGVPRGEAEQAYAEAHEGKGRNLARRVITAQLELAKALAATPDGGEPTGEYELVLARGPGERDNGVYLYPAGHAPSPLAATPSGESGGKGTGATDGEPLAALAATPKGGGRSGGESARGDGEAQAGEGEQPKLPGEEHDIPW